MTTEQKKETLNDCSKCKNCECKKVEPKLCIKCNKNEKMKERKICYECKKVWLKQYYIDKLKIDHPKPIGRPKIEKIEKIKKARGRPKKEVKKEEKQIYNDDLTYTINDE